MILRQLGASLALAAVVWASGCCHPFTHRAAAPPTVVSSAPVYCPPGGPAPGEAAAVPVPVPPPPTQSFSAPPPGTAVIR